MPSIDNSLTNYGLRNSDCIYLDDKNDHRLLRYVDLLGNGKSPAIVEAVIESQSQPLLYIITSGRLTGTSNNGKQQIAELRRRLAMRGEAAWLGVLWPGKLEIYSTDLQPNESVKGVEFNSNAPSSISVIPRLASGENLAQPAAIQLRQVLFGLMTDSGIELKELGLSVNESIALTGRALFFRFLIGRGIINEKHLTQITLHANSLENCFGNEKALIETNQWLDKTFNGDLLQLPTTCYEEYFQRLYRKHGNAIYRPLSAILGLDQPICPGASQGQLALSWGDLYFDHIPVGLLSETYEELMRQFDAKGRHQTSVYYTPGNIAEYMVAEALYQHPKGSKARVLDPACGAGIFLTTAFRKLAELQFEETGIRPQRCDLRKILNNQIVGFDINGHARMLGALALYLTALELDPHPNPIDDLKFDKLEGHVLIDVADSKSDSNTLEAMAGSIGCHVPKTFHNSFDLVIGNPPWTALSGKNKALNTIFTNRCREVAQKRGFCDLAETYQNPDNVTDLPFLWCAMDWAKDNGRICFAMAGRFLFKRSGNGFLARQAIFKTLAVTGILNGSALRKTQVWPNVSQPFCLLFADNRIPERSDEFVFISPEEDPNLNSKGRMRIDPSDAEAICINEVIEQATLLKTLFRGSTRDANFIRRLTSYASQTLGQYWNHENGLCSGQGFHVASRKFDDSFLDGLPVITAHYKAHPFTIVKNELPLYKPQGLWRPRSPEIYKGPLVLLRESTKSNRDQGQALFSASDVAYQGSFYGFSAAGKNDGDFISRYLFVLVHSSLFEYFQLMTSAKFGVEREAIQVTDAKEFPLVEPSRLNQKQREYIIQAAELLLSNTPNWSSLDKTIYDIYCVSDTDAAMIKDSLETRSPFTRSISNALRTVDIIDTSAFCEQLTDHLNKVFCKSNTKVKVDVLDNSNGLPWRFLKITNDKVLNKDSQMTIPSEWLNFADSYSVSRVTVSDQQNLTLVIGLLDRYRYWTPSQARMLATDIIWQHGATLEGDIE